MERSIAPLAHCAIGAVAAFVLCQAHAASAVTTFLSGGGTNKIFDAIEATSNTPSLIMITDSATYTEINKNLFVGPRNGVGRAVSIESAAGQTPQIVLQTSSFLAYSGCPDDVHIGSAAGGQISIDARTPGAPGTPVKIWYIGQDNGRTGPACQLTLENLFIDMSGLLLPDGIAFGAGGNDAVNTTTNPTMTFKDVCTSGGLNGAISCLYFGNHPTTNTVNIENCVLLETGLNGVGVVDAGKYGGNQPNSVVNITSSVIYTSPATAGASSDSNGVVCRIGSCNIDHCDIVNDGSSVSHGVAVVDAGGIVSIKNSIVEGDIGTFISAGNGAATDSNVHGRTTQNMGFAYSSVINEWPVYAYVGPDKNDPLFFKLLFNSLSATHGSSPPLGSRGLAPPSQSVAHNWELYE